MTLFQSRNLKFITRMTRSGFSLILSACLVFENLPFENQSLAEVQSFLEFPERIGWPSSKDIHKLVLKNMRKGKVYRSQRDLGLVLIQDLHCNFEAQVHISDAIRQIYKRTGISKVFIEGAQGTVHTILYQTFPDKEVRRRVALEFVKSGYLTGAEFALIEMGREDVELYGVEEAALYLKNFRAFRETRHMYESLKIHLNEFESWIDELKTKEYTQSLKNLDEMQQELDSVNPKIHRILKKLRNILNQNVEIAKKYKNLANLSEIVNLGKELDQENFRKELEHLIQDFQKEFMKEDLKGFVNKTLQYRLGRLSLLQYLRDVKKMYQTLNGKDRSFSQKYPYLQTCIKIFRKEESLKFDEIRNELEQILEDLMWVYAQRSDLKEEVALGRQWRLFKRLIRLELSREDLEKLKGSNIPREFKFLYKSIVGFKNKKQQPHSIPQYPSQIDTLVKSAWSFYTLAQSRDRVLIMKTLDRMKRSYVQNGILITGGFHTKGIQNILEKENISYVTWTPELKKELQQERYEEVMMDERYNLSTPEFSDKRVVWKTQNARTLRMLSAPVLLNEILETLGSHLKQAKIEMLQKMVHELDDMTTLNQILNVWMTSKRNVDLLRDLTREDFDLLFQALDRDQVFLELTDLDAENKIHAQLALNSVRKAYQDKFPALVRLTEQYFDPSIVSKRNVTEFLYSEKPGVAQINLPEAGNFSLTPHGTLSGKSGITNSEVGLQIKAVLDRAQLSPTETRLEGEVLSFTAGQIKERRGEDTLGQLASLMKSPVYSALDQNVRNTFETTRLLVLPDRVALAENEKGASYAHYGEAFGPTMFIGKMLLDYLLEHDPEGLTMLIQFEMDRRMFREKRGLDQRSSSEVAVQVSVDSVKLTQSIALSKIREFLLNYKNRESSSVIQTLKILELVMEHRDDLMNQDSLLAFEQILGVELGKEEINWEICETALLALEFILKTRPALFQESSFLVLQEFFKKDIPMDLVLKVTGAVDVLARKRMDLLRHVEENTITTLRNIIETKDLKWWKYIVPVYFFTTMAKNKVKTDVFDKSFLSSIEGFFYRGANRLGPYLWDLLRAIYYAEPELTFSPLANRVIHLPRENVGDSLAHHEIYNNVHFRSAISRLSEEEQSESYAHSVALSAYRLLRRYRLPLNEVNVGKATYIIVNQRNRVSQIEVFGPDIPVINILHADDKMYVLKDVESFEKKAGVKSINSYVGPGAKQDVLNKISESRGPLRIFFRGHGGPRHLWLQGGEPGNEDSKDLEASRGISYQELGEALSKRDLHSLILIIDACYPYNLITERLLNHFEKKGVRRFPIIASSSSLDQWSYGGFLYALYDDDQDKLKIQSPSESVRVQELFLAEKEAFNKQDFVIFAPVDPDEIRLFFGLPLSSEASSLQISSGENIDPSEPIVPQIPEKMLEIGAIFNSYRDAQPQTFLQKIFFWLGEPRWIGPIWEEAVFRLSALGLTHVTFSNLLNVKGLGLALGVSVGVFSAVHGFVKWNRDGRPKGFLKKYLLPSLKKYFIPSLILTATYLLIVSLFAGLPFLGPLIALGVNVIFHSVYNRVILDQRKDETQSLSSPFDEVLATSNFALNAEGEISGAEGITNTEVGFQIREALDRVRLSPSQTRLDGEILSFTVGEIKESKGEDLPGQLASFLNSSTYSALDDATKKAFDRARMVVFQNQISVAENEKGASYAHYGEAYGPTIFIGGRLLEELLKHDPESLGVLVRLEMNRSEYRKINQEDRRSSREIVKDVRIENVSIRRLQMAIAKAEAKELLSKWGEQRIAQFIIQSARMIAEKGEKEIEVDDIALGNLKGFVLEAVVEILAQKMRDNEERLQVKHAAQKLKETRHLKWKEALVKDLKSVIQEEANAEVLEINLPLGEAQLHLSGGKTKSVELNDLASQALSLMVGKKAGEMEQVLIDLKRNTDVEERGLLIEEAVKSLLEGEPLSKGKSENLGNIHLEHLRIEDIELIHISRGETEIRKVQEQKNVIEAFEFFEASLLKGTNPVAMDVELLRALDEGERSRFIRQYGARIALVRGEKIEGISQKDQEDLWKNGDQFMAIEDPNYKVAILSKEGHLVPEMRGASVLRMEIGQIEGFSYVAQLAGYIADVGKEKAKEDPKANEMLRDVLRVLYEEGQIPQEIIEEMPLEKILNDPKGFLFPPIKTVDVMDIESYMRAKRAVATMA